MLYGFAKNIWRNERAMRFNGAMIYEELAKSYLARSEKQSQITEVLLDKAAGYEESGQAAASTICAAALHVNMLSHDVLALMLLHSLTDDKWTNRTAARMAATVMYEGADDLQIIFGKPFRDACQEVGILAEFEPDLGRIKQELASFQKNHEPVIKVMRMASGAHRDHDIATFLGSFLDESKTTAVVEAFVEFENCLRSWGAFNTSVLNRLRDLLGS